MELTRADITKLDPRSKVARYDYGFGGFERFCDEQLVIEPRGGRGEVALVPNRAQQYILARMEQQFDDLGYIRILNLKARRLGASTIYCAYLFWMAQFFPNTRCKIMTHQAATHRDLWRFIEM